MDFVNSHADDIYQLIHSLGVNLSFRRLQQTLQGLLNEQFWTAVNPNAHPDLKLCDVKMINPHLAELVNIFGSALRAGQDDCLANTVWNFLQATKGTRYSMKVEEFFSSRKWRVHLDNLDDLSRVAPGPFIDMIVDALERCPKTTMDRFRAVINSNH